MIDRTQASDRPFIPDWVSPPGETISDILEERGWPQAQLAERLGYSPKHVNQLIKGKVPLTEDAATRLASVLGSTVGFWLRREAQYRERAALLESAARHAAMVPWLEKMPVKELMDANAIPKRRIDAKSKPGLVAELLSFFGVATPDQWQSHYGGMELAFRRTKQEQSDVGAISAWLRMGERIAEQVDSPRYDEARFRAALAAARALTPLGQQEFLPRLTKSLHEAGVVLVLAPAIPRAHVSGVARWLAPNRPLIQIALHGESNDKFWFTLFHEAAHILLHGKEKKTVFLDDPNHGGLHSELEQEADAWARDFLIPPDKAAGLAGLPKTTEAVQQFAAALGLHPAIVVGRLQHDRLIKATSMNGLKGKLGSAQVETVRQAV